MTPFSKDEALRYRRQVILPEIGETGQQRLQKATVMIAGLGGLGGLSAFYMAAAGIGRLMIVDNDQVALHNLNRQLLYTTADIGEWKAECAQSRLQALNLNCQIEASNVSIQADTIFEIARHCDMIIDGTDNFATRNILNRIAVALKIPFIFGGVNGFDGMMAAFHPGQGGCLSCLFPNPPAKPAEEIGIIGPTAGVIASLQSMAAITLLVGKGSSAAGVLHHFHGFDMRLKKMAIEKNPDCPVCG